MTDPSALVEEIAGELLAESPAAFTSLVMDDPFLQGEVFGLKTDAENGLRAIRDNRGTLFDLDQRLRARKTAILARLPEGHHHFTVERLLAAAIQRVLDAGREMTP